MHDEARMNSHPIYGKLRKLRYKEDFLYSYEEIDKMFGLLFMNNKEKPRPRLLHGFAENAEG